jgi:beta-glucanase (GH16 family)
MWSGLLAFTFGMFGALGLGALFVADDTTAPGVQPAAVEVTSAPVTTMPPIVEPVVAITVTADDATVPSSADIMAAFGVEPHPLAAGEWTLAFADEFDGTMLNAGAWTTCHWWDDGGCTIASNDELEWYQPGNVTLLNGALRLTAEREVAVAPNGQTFEYTSGMVSSGRDGERWEGDPRFTFTHGYVEMRARIPSGAGLWPSFWLLPDDHRAKPQIDIMAALGSSPSVLRVHTNYIEHRDGQRVERTDGIRHAGLDLSEDWHVFGLLWEEHRLVWYLDGNKVWTTTDPAEIPTEPMYLIASLAVGGEYAGSPDATTRFPATFHIDYIRVWQSVS